MRVTFLHYIHGTTGPGVQVREFAGAFRSLGHEVSLQAMDEALSASGGLKASAPRRFLSSCFHEINSLRKNFFSFARECRIVEREHPDILLTRYKLYRGSAPSVARKFRIPLVLWVHSPAAYEQREYSKEFFRIPGLAESMERKILKMADRLIVVSEELKEFLTREYHIENYKMAVIPNGVDPEKFRPEMDGQAIRKKFPFPNPVILGFVGSFSPWHGMETLKRLAKSALEKYPSTCLLLVGEGPKRAEFEKFIGALGHDSRRVHFAGSVEYPKVPEYVAAMDVCLLPYEQPEEKFYFSPLKLFEYMASAKAVLASRIGQVEKIIQDGVNGTLYSPTSGSEAVRGLAPLIQSAPFRERLGRAARQTILEKYTWRHTAQAVERVLEESLKNRRPAS